MGVADVVDRTQRLVLNIVNNLGTVQCRHGVCGNMRVEIQ